MKMKLKSWHLYVLATLCFLFAFTSLNMKYDRFYRVNGIDNDNRSLIEKYLDKEEQDYLIDHGISVDEFIDYITYDQFHLQYYQYYNELKEAKKYDVPLEVNAGGIRKGLVYRNDEMVYPYNNDHFFHISQEIDNKVILGIDAHHPQQFNTKDIELLNQFVEKHHLNKINKLTFKKGNSH